MITPLRMGTLVVLKRLLVRFLLRLFLGLLLVLFIIGGGLYWLHEHRLKAPLSLPTEDFHYTVPQGASLRQVALDLAREKIFDYPTAVGWLLFARLKDKARSIKAGEYAVPPGTSAEQLLEIFISGKPVEYALTLVEGWNFRQVMAAVDAHPKLKHELKGLDGALIMAKLGQPDLHPEGRFYPDTYHFTRNTSDLEFLQRAYRKMERELAAAWAERAPDLPLNSPGEALILASNVETETGLAEERDKVAGVFIRRLRQGMRLQTDPTVIYGLGESFDGNLRRSDLELDTPYNTYTRSGLPPTPIAMPGRQALRAAVNPAEGDSLYFVARKDGGHHFSKTLSEHQCAVLEHQIKPHSPRRFRNQCQKYPGCPICRAQ